MLRKTVSVKNSLMTQKDQKHVISETGAPKVPQKYVGIVMKDFSPFKENHTVNLVVKDVLDVNKQITAGDVPMDIIPMNKNPAPLAQLDV